MPRFLIERSFTVDPSLAANAIARSRALLREQYPELVWEHSHIVFAADGTPKSFCVYSSPNEELLRQHAEGLGDHFVEVIYEIATDLSPGDFPAEDPDNN